MVHNLDLVTTTFVVLFICQMTSSMPSMPSKWHNRVINFTRKSLRLVHSSNQENYLKDNGLG
jgi:hypothetical protein